MPMNQLSHNRSNDVNVSNCYSSSYGLKVSVKKRSTTKLDKSLLFLNKISSR